MSESTIYSKILLAQQEVGKMSKDKENPFFKSQYFDINQVIDQLMPVLWKHNLSVMQPLTNIEGNPAIKTMIFDTKTGEMITETTPIPSNADPQKTGSAITYFRRYALVSAFGLSAEDDDGNHASGNAPKQASKPASNKKELPWLNPNTPDWKTALDVLKNGYTDKTTGKHVDGSIPVLQKKWRISKENQEKLKEQAI